MGADINLINKHFILNYQSQKAIFILLVIFIISLNIYNYYFIRSSLGQTHNQLMNIEEIILSEQEVSEINWLNRNLIRFNINNWYNIFQDLLSDIADINSIYFSENSWEIRGDLIDIENYQTLYERINELSLLNFEINFNRVGSLQNSSFLLQINIGDASE